MIWQAWTAMTLCRALPKRSLQGCSTASCLLLCCAKCLPKPLLFSGCIPGGNGMPAQVSERLTGFVHNAVTPVGLATPEMPIVLSHRIQALGGSDGAGFMWFGGGEPDLKLGMPVAAFVRAYSPFVCDCTYDGASEEAEDVDGCV